MDSTKGLFSLFSRWRSAHASMQSDQRHSTSLPTELLQYPVVNVLAFFLDANHLFLTSQGVRYSKNQFHRYPYVDHQTIIRLYAPFFVKACTCTCIVFGKSVKTQSNEVLYERSL